MIKTNLIKRTICFITAAAFFVPCTAFAEGKENELGVNAKAAILMEASTGKVLYELNPDEQLPIASVTKIMTMLLIMEEVDGGRLTLDDMVSVSENAMSYGGSTMFLETGEQLSVNDMLKGIAVASANDGCVAMAEHIAGSEEAFVAKMNERAAALGMDNTHFVNTNGLDEDGHYSSARDVAVMSRELISHEKIFDYTSIWMDELRGGKFQLANTNKLIRFYNGANGLKTGSTSKALCCLSATAKRDNMQLIAVVLGAPTSAERFESAKKLLDYGFANYSITTHITAGDALDSVPIKKGVEETVGAAAAYTYSRLARKGSEENTESEIILDENLCAPIAKGDKLGVIRFTSGGETLAEVDIISTSDAAKKSVAAIIGEFFTEIMYGSGKNSDEKSEEIY